MALVMAFGTFDIVHPGHLHFLNSAKKLGQKLIVVIARDETVKAIKGRSPLRDEQHRLNNVKDTGIPTEVYLGSLTNRYELIEKFQPDIIALGYDQIYFTGILAKKFPEIKLIRIDSFEPQKYKSSKLNY